MSAWIIDTFASYRMPKLPNGRAGRDPQALSSPIMPSDPSNGGITEPISVLFPKPHSNPSTFEDNIIKLIKLNS